jgi:hypothetical protein
MKEVEEDSEDNDKNDNNDDDNVDAFSLSPGKLSMPIKLRTTARSTFKQCAWGSSLKARPFSITIKNSGSQQRRMSSLLGQN